MINVVSEVEDVDDYDILDEQYETYTAMEEKNYNSQAEEVINQEPQEYEAIDENYDDVEVVESNICMDLDKLDKLNYFATSLPTERKEVSEYMWGFLSDGNSKERYEYQMIKKLVGTYDKEPQKFWDYWIETSKSSKERTKIKNMKQKFVEVKADDEAADSE